jgi:hypothetical protein
VANICWAKGNYGCPFKAGRSVIQGGPLLAKLFNILINAVVQEWMRLMRETINNVGGNLAKCIAGLFVVFYINDGYIASRNVEFLQEALNILAKTFKCIGLATNTKKTQAMVCTLGRIQAQPPLDLYKRMREGAATGKDLQRAVVCHVCDKPLQARSLRPYLLSAHDIHQQVVVADALLEEWEGVYYRADPGGRKDPIHCPFPGCPGMLSNPYMLRHHFWDLHLKDTVKIPREGNLLQCKRCTMQCNLRYPQHISTQVCLLGAEQRTQRDSAVLAALALRKLFCVEGEVLEKVDLFQYLGWILAQDDDDVRTVRQQIKKARAIWARVGQVLTAENTQPKVSAKFYKAVMQSVLLYGSKTWALTTTTLARLKGFHIPAAYQMAEKHKPKKGLHHKWVYLRSSDTLQEYGMATILHYINARRATIFRYVVDWPIYKACREGELRRGLPP